MLPSRGCPYNCIYCTVGLVSGRPWRSRTPENIIAELKSAKKKYGITEFEILDDTFTQKVDRAIKFCDLLINEKINLKWSCPNGIRADRINEELAQKMKESGCHTVLFGVESGNPEVFENIKKGETLEDIERAVKIFKNAGIKAGGYFIIGLPYDNLEKTMESLQFARKIGLDWSHFNILVPYPKTRVWDSITNEGRFIEDYKRGSHFANIIKPVFEMKNFTAQDLVAAYEMVHTKQRLFYMMLDKNKPRWRRYVRISYLLLKYEFFYSLKMFISRLFRKK